MILVNIPLAIGWFLVYQGDAVWKIFTGCAFLGLSVGLMEASLITYLGEIWLASSISDKNRKKFEHILFLVSHQLVVSWYPLHSLVFQLEVLCVFSSTL